MRATFSPGAVPTIGPPEPVPNADGGLDFDVAPDGRLLLRVPDQTNAVTPDQLDIILHWTDLLSRTAPRP